MSEETQRSVGPVDLEALALHVTKLSGALEQAWSDALDRIVMAQAEDELNGELSAFVTTMTGALAETDAKLVAAGIDPTIYSWPYDPEVFKALEPDPDPGARRTRLVIAQMIAVRELLVAFKALHEPTGEEIDLVAQSRTEWFEAGAFSLFKSQAALLLRVTRDVDRVTDILLAEPLVSKLDLSVEAAFESLKAGRGAYSRGDLDAAVIHCRAALRGVLESLPFVERDDQRFQRPGTFLAGVPSLSEYASALRLLDAEADALTVRRADLGIAVPLIDGLLPQIAAIVSEPPIVELQEIIAAEGEEG